jgi:hypothetical protein
MTDNIAQRAVELYKALRCDAEGGELEMITHALMEVADQARTTIDDATTFAMVELRLLRLMEDADRAGSEIGSRDTRIALKILRMAFPELQPKSSPTD